MQSPRIERQRLCALSKAGHDFPLLGEWGSCRKCGLTVPPPGPDGDGGERLPVAA